MFKVISLVIAPIAFASLLSVNTSHAQMAIPGSGALQTLSTVNSVAPGALKSPAVSGMAKDMAIKAAKDRAKEEATGAIGKTKLGAAGKKLGGHAATARQLGEAAGVNPVSKVKIPFQN